MSYNYENEKPMIFAEDGIREYFGIRMFDLSVSEARVKELEAIIKEALELNNKNLGLREVTKILEKGI